MAKIARTWLLQVIYGVFLTIIAGVYGLQVQEDVASTLQKNPVEGNTNKCIEKNMRIEDNKMVYKREWANNKIRSWGKRNTEKEDKRAWNNNQMRVWGKRDETKRGWSDNNVRVWGKRYANKRGDWNTEMNERLWNFKKDADAGKRTWGNNNMRVWGKRSDPNFDSKRGWSDNKARVWGKRNDIIEEMQDEQEDKRGWGDNKMRVWGKRNSVDEKRWNDKQTRLWGKRDSDILSTLTTEKEIRAWANNQMKAWGKKDLDNLKRAWNNNMRAWGKRSHPHEDVESWKENLKSENVPNEQSTAYIYSEEKSNLLHPNSQPENWGKWEKQDDQNNDKRNWRTNKMRVWGKRNQALDQEEPKRAWSHGSQRVWGKRADRPLTSDNSSEAEVDQE